MSDPERAVVRREGALRRRVLTGLGLLLLAASAVLGIVGVAVYTGGSDLGALHLVGALALLTAGAGVIVASRGGGSAVSPARTGDRPGSRGGPPAGRPS